MTKKAGDLIKGMDASSLNGIKTCQSRVIYKPLEQTEASDMKIDTLGIDLPKNVFQIYGVDELYKVAFSSSLKKS